jgi:hypothetical protein
VRLCDFCSASSDGGHAERWSTPDRIASHIHWHATDRYEVNSRTGIAQCLRERGAGLKHMLAGVQNKQGFAIAQVGDQRVDNRLAGVYTHVEDAGYRAGHNWAVDRGKVDEPDPINVRAARLRRQPAREPRLTDTSWAYQREQARPALQAI